MRKTFDSRLRAWLAKKHPAADLVVLNRKNIFILPSRHGLVFITTAVLIFIAAINYSISMAFALSFLMVSLFVVSILHCFRNLRGLSLKSLPARAVFAGDDAVFPVLLGQTGEDRHESLHLGFTAAGALTATAEVGRKAGKEAGRVEQEPVNLYIRSEARGRFRPPRIRVETSFPLGLCRAWSSCDLDLECLVYPRPVPCVLDEAPALHRSGEALMQQPGGEDFAGLRRYLPGDPIKQIAWKKLARGMGLMTKQFEDSADTRLILDWDMFFGFGTEERLSRLCYCVLKLSRAQCEYGLKLPGVEIAPASGEAHKIRILECLALYRADAAARPAPARQAA